MAALSVKECETMINVFMGDLKTARGDKRFITRDLGSCIAIAMRDATNGVGGLLHIMLPKAPKPRTGETPCIAKYADTGIDELVRMLIQKGAKRENLTAKLAGGAHMVKTEDVSEDRDISSRNYLAVRRKLNSMNIPVLALDVGEHYPRTVVFDLPTGTLRIVSPGRADKYI
jgi:chemotaxis protein CheD